MSTVKDRPEATEFAPYYGAYIERVPEGDLLRILAAQVEETAALLGSAAARERADFRYAPEKWTLKEVVGHLADTERVMGYRALRMARGDSTPLAGFDEKAYTPMGQFSARTLESLVDELVTVRKGTVALFAGLPEAAWLRSGTASGAAVSVRALAWIIAGHELHHRELIRTRYLQA